MIICRGHGAHQILMCVEPKRINDLLQLCTLGT